MERIEELKQKYPRFNPHDYFRENKERLILKTVLVEKSLYGIGEKLEEWIQFFTNLRKPQFEEIFVSNRYEGGDNIIITVEGFMKETDNQFELRRLEEMEKIELTKLLKEEKIKQQENAEKDLYLSLRRKYKNLED